MAENLAKFRGSRKVFVQPIANLQGVILNLLSHKTNDQKEHLKNSPIKCWTKLERKTAEVKDLTNKIITLLSYEEHE